MSWNGSDQSSPTPRKRATPPRRTSSTSPTSSTSSPSKNHPPLSTSTSPSTSLLRGALAGLIVVALAAAALWYFVLRAPAPRPSTSTSPSTSSHRIAETKPALAPTNAAPVQLEKPKPKPKPYWEQATTNGLAGWQILKWKHHRLPPPAVSNTTALSRKPPEYAVFGTHAENEIAVLLTLQPGTMLVGTPEYGEDFKKEFLKSCETPILIDPNDSDYVRQLKKDMIDTKIELRQRMSDGEDLTKIMTEARGEMVRLGMMKQDIESQVHELVGTGSATEADFDDAVAAANKILESKGIAPIAYNPVVKQSLMRDLGIKRTRKRTADNKTAESEKGNEE